MQQVSELGTMWLRDMDWFNIYQYSKYSKGDLQELEIKHVQYTLGIICDSSTTDYLPQRQADQRDLNESL